MKFDWLTKIGAVLLGAGLLFLAPPVSSGAGEPDAVVEEPADGEEVETLPVKRIKMYAENWRFIPKVIRVKQGTPLVIDFVSRDASHSFVLKAYKIKVPLPEGSTAQIEFIASEVGTFKFRCGRPCGNGCAKMHGELIVEE